MTANRRLHLVDSTLREGEQHPGVRFSAQDRIDIAQALAEFGAEIIEVPTPVASPRSTSDLRALAALDLTSKIAAHTRCRPDEIRLAADCGADAVHVYLGSSDALRRHSHGRDLSAILEAVEQAAITIDECGIEGRFSCEDAFRTPPHELARIALHVEQAGFSRFGLADTIGIATPAQVADVFSLVRKLVSIDLEFHGHNDAGCAVANAHAAFCSGATHIDVTALGLGERNGITPLSGFMARLWVSNRDLTSAYQLPLLPAIDRLVADRAGVPVPFSSCISGAHAFTHKAGPHVKAVVSSPESYEVLDPDQFGRRRTIDASHRLTGHHAIAHRAEELGIKLDPLAAKRITETVKSESDSREFGYQELDLLIQATATREGESDGHSC